MFFSKIRDYARAGLNKGFATIKKTPGFITNFVTTTKQIADTADRVGAKASQVQGVYNKSKGLLGVKSGSKFDSGVMKGFDTVSSGVKDIRQAQKTVDTVGNNVLSLF
jgi:hypothetical protein